MVSVAQYIVFCLIVYLIGFWLPLWYFSLFQMYFIWTTSCPYELLKKKTIWHPYIKISRTILSTTFLKNIHLSILYCYNVLLLIMEWQYCIWRVGVVNCGFDGRKCSLSGEARRASKTDIWDRQFHNWHRQLFKYSTVFHIVMKSSQRVHTSLKTYK